MLVNELGPKTPEDYDHNYECAMRTFEQKETFPIEDHGQFRDLKNKYAQKPLYRALVDTYGRAATIEGLGKLIPAEVVKLQLNVLIGEEAKTDSPATD